MRRREAFTIFEAVLGVSLAILILGGLVLLVTRSSSFVGRSEVRLDRRELAARTLTILRNALDDSWGYSLGSEEGGLVFLTPRGRGWVRRNSAEGSLVFGSPEEDGEAVLIEEGVRALHLDEIRRGFLRISLELDSGREDAPLVLTDEVLLPCVPPLNRRVPWRQDLSYPPRLR